MERTDLVIKAIIGFLSGIVSMMVDSLGLMFTVLLGMMAIDFITGFLASAVEGKLSSNVGTKGLFKKVYIILLLGAVFLIEVSIIKSNGVVTDGISGAFIVIEFVSIVENGERLNIPIPSGLRKLLATLKNKTEEKENKEG